MKKRIRSTLREDTNTFLGHKHLVRKCLRDWLPAVWDPLFFFFFFEMKIKCGDFLLVERTTLENLSSTSHVISRSGGLGCLPLNRRKAQHGPRVRLENLSCAASLRPNLHQLQKFCLLAGVHSGVRVIGVIPGLVAAGLVGAFRCHRLFAFAGHQSTVGKKMQPQELAERRQFFCFLS